MNIFWFRRDLRIEDNHGLYAALDKGKTMPVFIFDDKILEDLEKDDARVSFIYKSLKSIDLKLREYDSGVRIYAGNTLEIFKQIIDEEEPEAIYLNDDYEPYAIQRDKQIESLAKEKNIGFHRFKDQVIFEKNEILKSDGRPYHVFTAYKNKWLSKFSGADQYNSVSKLDNLIRFNNEFPELISIGFTESHKSVMHYNFSGLEEYENVRNYPALDKTSHSSVHLRFGTLSVRQAILLALKTNQTILSELIWREFFMQILFHYPEVENNSFNPKYRDIQWINDESDFEKWKSGMTGYPLVDAGMRQLDQTGYMHNRVRMIAAGFLTKHLLIDWRWGERHFAAKLLDYDMAANNGNWQWAAGTGCDAAPYFRIFNPVAQQEKFDKNQEYIKKCIPELGTPNYPLPMIEHKFARERAIAVFSRIN